MFGPFGLGSRPFYRTKPLPVLHRFWLHFRDKGEHGIMECMAINYDDARIQARKARLGVVFVEQKHDSISTTTPDCPAPPAGSNHQPHTS